MINCRAVIFSMDPLPSQSGAGGTQSSLRGCSQQCRGHKSFEQHSFIQHQPSTSCVLHQVIYSWVCEKDCKVVPWEIGNSMPIFTLGLLFRLFAIYSLFALCVLKRNAHFAPRCPCCSLYPNDVLDRVGPTADAIVHCRCWQTSRC